MLYQVLLSCLLYLSVYASPSELSKTHFPSMEEALVGVVSLFFPSLIPCFVVGSL